ncbi:MAG: ABC transporter ATP-binding protein [Thermoplasmata archaeon]|nr:ABC transporter ATP-binding protein [Thermoplasmata archaeon]
MSQIRLSEVSKAYYTTRRMDDARVVLDRVNLNIEEGEFITIIGPSGCGKTTILNMIAGFEGPTLGKVLFKDNEIEGPSPERGVVFQEFSLLPWMSVRSNIELALECKKVPEKDRKEIALKALKAVGLENFADYRPNLLSGGMKQRVAIARLLAMDSEVFLMDEPFSALDEQTRTKLDKDIVKIWKERKKTVVFVTHSIDEAIQLSTRIVLLSSSPGKVIKEWRLDENLYRDPMSYDMIKLKKEILALMPTCSCSN